MTQANRQEWLEETIARMIACDFIEPTERLVAILWLKEAMAFADQHPITPPPAPSGGELNTVLLGWRLYALAVDKAAFSDETMNSLEARIVEYIQALHPAPPVAGVGEADVWLEAGRMADSAGKMATIMGAIETARGQYSLADAFKAKAQAALKVERDSI